MKKLSIVLLAVFFIGIANVNAQSLFPSKTANSEEVKKCSKTGKVCNETCKNKATGTCCQGKKSSCSKKNASKSCSKSKASCSKKAKKGCCKSNKSSCGKKNDSKSCSKSKTSCSKKAKKGCCKKKAKKCGEDCTKPCCAPPTIEKTTPSVIEEDVEENE